MRVGDRSLWEMFKRIGSRLNNLLCPEVELIIYDANRFRSGSDLRHGFMGSNIFPQTIFKISPEFWSRGRGRPRDRTLMDGQTMRQRDGRIEDVIYGYPSSRGLSLRLFPEFFFELRRERRPIETCGLYEFLHLRKALFKTHIRFTQSLLAVDFFVTSPLH